MNNQTRFRFGLAFPVFLLLASFLLGMPDTLYAQLPAGSRNLGKPIQVQPNPSQAATGGNAGAGIMGSARFLRQNRSRRDFVGSNRSDQSGFVGSQQSLGVGQVAPALGGGAAAIGNAARGAAANRRNPPLPPLSKKAMYYPRLDIGSLDTTNRSEQWPAEVSARLSERLADLSAGAVTVQVEGRRATLEGTVRTRAEADRLRHLAEFEPGVDEVIDQLRVEQPNEK